MHFTAPTRSLAMRWIALLAILSFAILSFAQSDTARLQGIITDVQGAAVTGATVSITNVGTGRNLTVQSSETGDFTATALPPGQYLVEVSKAGFSTRKQQITLQTAQSANLPVQLKPGAVSETIEVKSDLPIVESTSSNLGAVVVGKQVTELPLNGRNFTQLATLVPGVTRGVLEGNTSGTSGSAETFRYGNTGGAALSVNGLRAQANSFILDGVDNNESLVNTIVFFPPAEAIQEFRVDTSVAPAEFGRAGGGVVNTTFKSGTNSWHGTAFWFLRNDNLDARPYFNKAEDAQGNSLDKPEFKRHQFGGTLGGALIKNKLFVFGDYQGLRQYLPLSLERISVPTERMRNGDFSEVTTQLVNPATGLPFAGNIIPSNLINQAGQAYLNAFPLPNCGPATDPLCNTLSNNYKEQRNQIQEFNDFDVRVDWNIGANDTLFGRYSYGKDHSVTSSRLPNLPAGWGSGDNINWPRALVLGETHIFSPNLINEFRFGAVRVKYGYEPPMQDTPVSADLGIVNANTSSLLGGGALIGSDRLEWTGDYGPYLVPQNTFQYSDTVTWLKNNHTFKFGANIIRRQVNLFRPKHGKGTFDFRNGDSGSGSITGYEVADMLAGFVGRYQVGPALGMSGTRNWETGYFIQDDWRISRRLTLNLGLRYDLYTWPVEVHDWQANFDLDNGRLLLAGQDGASRSFVDTDTNNFAPRIGFAYDLTGNGKTVLRGGYGAFYFLDRGGIDNQLAQNPPFSGNSTYLHTNGYRITFSGMGPMNDNNPANATGALPGKGVLNIDLNNPQNVDVFAARSSNVTPYVQQWNLQVQHEIAANMVASVAYVGTVSHKLMSYYNMNRQPYAEPTTARLYPNLGSVTAQDTRGNSNYHSLQARLEKRLTRGLQFNSSYTWSHTIDDSPDAYDNQNAQVDYRTLGAERANSSLDVRHRLVFSTLYEMPFGKGQQYGANWSGVTDAILGGWQVNGILTLQSGMPFDIRYDWSTNPWVRPDLVHTPNNAHDIDNGTWFDVTAFAMPPSTIVPGVMDRAGTLKRNYMSGPGTHVFDMSLFKNFQVTERVQTQFRTEFYNLTNTPQFSQPDGNLASWNSNRGKITSTRLGTERQIQFALRLSF